MASNEKKFSNKYWLEGALLVTLSMTNFAVIWIPGLSPITLFIILGFLYLCISAKSFLKKLSIIRSGGGILLIFFVFSNIINIAEARLSSLLYSLFFIAIFFTLKDKLQEIPYSYFVKISKIIIYTSLLGTMLAQLGSQTSDFLSVFSVFVSIDEKSGDYRYMGFTSEPSYAAFVVMTAYYILVLWQLKINRFYAMPAFAVAYQLFYFGSIYGYLLAAILVAWVITQLYKIKRNRTTLLAILIPLVPIIFLMIGFYSGSRLISLLTAIFSMQIDLATFNEIDSSAWMRIAPIFIYFEKLDISNIHTYIGFGTLSANKFFSLEFGEHIGDSVGTREGFIEAGFIPAFFYAYGLIGALLCYFYFFREIFKTLFFIELLFMLLMLMNANINTQLFFYVVIFMLVASAFHRASFPDK